MFTDNAMKDVKKHLDSIQRDYISNVRRIKGEMLNYNKESFEKFIFQFHKTTTELLKTDKNYTLDELIEEMKNISTKIYQLVKLIKDKENELLAEKDKKKFAGLKKEIEKLNAEKNYFSVLHKNITKHNLIPLMQEISYRMNRIGYSGEMSRREEAAYVVSKSDEYVTAISSFKYEPLSFITLLLDRLFSKKGLPKKDSHVNEAPVAQAGGKALKLNDYEKKYIQQYIKLRAGEGHYATYTTQILNYIESLETHHHLEEIENVFKKNGWPPQYVEPTINSIREVLKYRK